LARYTDGHAYCFSCGYYQHADGEQQSTITNVMILGTPVRLSKRGLSEEICRKYRIHKDGDVLRFHYYDNTGQICGAKVKSLDKTFHWEGKNVDHQLFGQNLFPDKGTRLTIYEGEIDAASGYAAMPTWPHVSLPDGAQSAKKALQRAMPFLQGYEEIVLFFDNDDPGRKVKIARMEKYKDASDALQSNDAECIRRAVWDAKTYRPDGIIDAKTLLDDLTTPEEPCAYEFPFQGLQNKLRGIRYGELTTITAGSGIGKSSFCRDLATHLLNQGERVGYVALEESNRRTALGLMSSATNQSLHIGEHDRATLTKAYQDSIANWNLFLFDGFGSFDPDVIYNRIEYLATGLEVRVVFLDHLSILLSGLDGDERRMLDITMTRLRSLVERTGIALFLVSHLRRTSNDTNHEEGARVTLGQLRGSASIAQLSDSVIALERDQQSGPERNGTTVRVLKNRYSGEVGVACQLSYDLSTCRFTEYEIEEEFDPVTDF
jgi:twinkle protein